MIESRVKSLEAKGDFRFRHQGETYRILSPVAVSSDQLLGILWSGHVPGTPSKLAQWKHDLLFEAWAEHYGLPPFRDVQRLVYLINRYRDAIEYDLQANLSADLSGLWSAREWRKLLNFIDHLPRSSWYAEAVSQDEEHAEMLAQALEERESEGSGDRHPPLHTWTPEVGLLTDILDAVRNVSYTVAATQSTKKVKVPDPSLRPRSVLEQARAKVSRNRRQSKHQELVKRMLPHKR